MAKGEHAPAEIRELLGGALGADECELLWRPEKTRDLVAEVLGAVRAGRAVVVADGDLEAFATMDATRRDVLLSLPDPRGCAGACESSDEDLKRQVSALDSALLSAREQLAKAKNRKERMALLEPAAAKEVASLAAYESKLRFAIADEVEACTAAEVECIDAIKGMHAALVDLLERIEPSGPFLLPQSGVDELSSANSSFLESVQAMVDGGADATPGGAGDDGVNDMRGVAMQELQRLQDLFVYTELDRTDAMLMKEEALAVETVAQAQLGELASGDILAVQKKVGEQASEPWGQRCLLVSSPPHA
jgi:hypothetical protein